MLQPDRPGKRRAPQLSLGPRSTEDSVGADAGRQSPPLMPPPAGPPLPAAAPAAASVAPPTAPREPPAAGDHPLVIEAQPHWKRSGLETPSAAMPAAEPAAPKKRNVVERLLNWHRPERPEKDEDLSERAVQMAPPWLVSLVVHMLTLVILGLIYLPQVFEDRIDLVFSEKLGEQLEEDQLQTVQFDAIETETPVLAEELLPVDDPLAAPPELEVALLPANLATSDSLEIPTIGLALSGRQVGRKEALLAAYGGTAATEDAVRAGLEWLKRNQQRDGTWSLSGPYSDGCVSENRCAATAMALLAFAGAGHTHRSGDYQREVERGLKALLDMQDRDGNFFQAGPSHHRLYSQGQATIAICELYGMTGDSALRHPAQLAVDYAVKIQAPAGGWRYYPGQDTDTSVTGWFVMGLQSALMADLEVPRPTLYRIMEYLDTASPNGGSLYGYLPSEDPSLAMTAEALLCRQYLGWKRDDPRLKEGVEVLLANPMDLEDKDVYYWYYATQVLHHMEGEPWEKWNRVMRNLLPKEQVTGGRERGSWDPAEDAWGNHAGRLYMTCLSIYMLEVYYRHLPIYSYQLGP